MPVLLLDVMGTLVYDPFYVEMPAFFGTTIEELLRDKDPDAWPAFERSEIDEATLFERFFRDRRSFDHAALKRCMVEGYRWLDGIEPLLAQLKEAGVPMHALSNYPEWYHDIEGQLGLSRYLEWSFVSCDTGVRKPDPEAYLGAARTLGIATEECVFVDDRESNCEAARGQGMTAIRFRQVETLRAELVHRGLLGG